MTKTSLSLTDGVKRACYLQDTEGLTCLFVFQRVPPKHCRCVLSVSYFEEHFLPLKLDCNL